MNQSLSFIAAALLLSLVAGCATPAPAVGRETREWTHLQRSGSAASTEQPMMAGEAADKAYKRYIDAFGHPLPETFPRDSFTSGGGEQK